MMPNLSTASPQPAENRSVRTPRVSARRPRADRSCDIVVYLAAAAFAVSVADVRSRNRGNAAAAFARQSAMYLAHVAFGISLTAVGRSFRRDRTTAAHACRLVEDRRDDPRLDAMLAGLEQACLQMRSAPERAGPR